MNNGKIMFGRTEQRLKHCKGMAPISDRIYKYIRKARTYYKKDGSIYSDMYKIHRKAGGGTKGINAIFDNVEIDIWEVVFSTGDFDYDCSFIELLEDWWIDKTDSRNPTIGYNIQKGSAGSHQGIHKGHKIKIEMSILESLLTNGYPQKLIAKYFNVPRELIFRRIKEYWPDTNRNYYEALKKFLKPTLEKYIKQGYNVKQIAEFFPSLKRENGVQRATVYRWFKWIWGTRNFKQVQRSYLKEIVRSLILEGLNIPDMIEDNRLQLSKYQIMDIVKLSWGSMEMARIELRTPILINCYIRQYSNEMIIKILGLPGKDSLIWITDACLGITPNQARNFYRKGILRNFDSFYCILPNNYYD